MDINYEQKKVLALDDADRARFAIKAMLEDYGIIKIDLVSSGEECLISLKNHEYDILLCDYNLGEGMNGQQVLEEARHRKLLKSSSCFIMVTAETSSAMVMGAMEYQPDGYLIKPYSSNDLKLRLDRTLGVKQEFFKVDQAIDNQDLLTAIKHCDSKMKQSSRFTLKCLRIKAGLYLELKDYKKALHSYQEAMEIRPLSWAKLGLGKCYVLLEDYKKAIKYLSLLIREDKLFVEAYDWLAKAQMAIGHEKKAMDTLLSAAQKSPNAILRQMELGRVANINHELEMAEDSFKKSIKLGKFSCHKSVDNFLNLSEVLGERMNSAAPEDKSDLGADALRALKQAQIEFRGDEVNIKCHLAEADIHHKGGDEKKASQCIQQAEEDFKHLGETAPMDVVAKMAQVALDKGDITEANKLVAQINENLYDEDVSEITKDIVKRLEKQVKSEVVNNKAVDLFEKGDFLQALELFEEAVGTDKPSNTVLLNTLQGTIEVIKAGLVPEKNLLSLCGGYINKLSKLQRGDQGYQRYHKLIVIYNKLNDGGSGQIDSMDTQH